MQRAHGACILAEVGQPLMPKQLVEYQLEGGATILVEVDLPEGGIQRAGREGEIVKATQSFDEALEHVRPVAQKIISTLRTLTDVPDEMTVEFGIKLGARAGVVIASADVEANYKLTLKWKRPEK